MNNGGNLHINNSKKNPRLGSRVGWAGMLLVLVLTGCRLQPAVASPSTTPRASSTGLATSQPITPTVSPAARLLTATPTPTSLPSPTPTPDPYQAYRIETLATRQYGGGEVQIHATLAVTAYFTRTLISYPSDGLTIYGFMDVPRRGTSPYPVIIALHGYIDPQNYDTIDYTTRYADDLARAGFLVLHPNLRDYPPSDSGDNLFRVGMAVDVLNLIAIVKATGGQVGALQMAEPGEIGLWGHSMGGGVVTRVITVSSDVKAAFLYAPMSGDERQNFEAINAWSNGTRGIDELAVPENELLTISPIYYLDRILAAVSINHGLSDQLVPLQWSLDLCQRLQKLGKSVECFTYKGEPHTFYGPGDALLMQRARDFFERELGNTP